MVTHTKKRHSFKSIGEMTFLLTNKVREREQNLPIVSSQLEKQVELSKYESLFENKTQDRKKLFSNFMEREGERKKKNVNAFIAIL